MPLAERERVETIDIKTTVLVLPPPRKAPARSILAGSLKWNVERNAMEAHIDGLPLDGSRHCSALASHNAICSLKNCAIKQQFRPVTTR